MILLWYMKSLTTEENPLALVNTTVLEKSLNSEHHLGLAVVFGTTILDVLKALEMYVLLNLALYYLERFCF